MLTERIVRRASSRPSRRQEQGATLIFLVLMVMVILVTLIIVSANLAVNARRNTGEQRVALQSQYVAESGASLAKAKLSVFYDLSKNVSIPKDADRTDVRNQFGALCNLPPLAINATDPLLPLPNQKASVISPVGEIKNLKGVLICDLMANQVSKPALASIFKTYLTPELKNDLKMTDGDIGNFLDDLISPVQVSEGRLVPAEKGYGPITSRFSIAPVAVTRSSVDAYNFYFLISDLKSTSKIVKSASLGSRAVSSSPNNVSDRRVYSFTILRDSFAKYALFTNHHFSTPEDEKKDTNGLIYFSDQTQFSGPVHTNQTFNFLNKPYFGGKITSAGCEKGGIVEGSDTVEDSCGGATKFGGRFKFNDYKILSPTEFGLPNDSDSPQSPSVAGGGNPTLDGGSKWDKEFISLPRNSQDQAGDAKNVKAGLSGLSIAAPAKVRRISFGISGTSPKYQTISYTKSDAITGNILGSVQLRFNAAGDMQIFNGLIWVAAYKNTVSGEWQAGVGIPAKFNGVIFADNQVDSVFTDNATSPAGIAVADFAMLSLGSNKNIVLSDNLKYQNPPCSGASAKTAVCNPVDSNGKLLRNVLGIFSIGGEIQIANNGKNTTKNVDPDAKDGSGKAIPLNSPNNVTIHAVLMATGGGKDGVPGAVRVQNVLSDSPNRGSVNLLGGIIENYYGKFGENNPTGFHGFGRNFIYDTRMETGFAPPSFPTQKNWESGLSQVNFDGVPDYVGTKVVIPSKLFLNGDTVQVAP